MVPLKAGHQRKVDRGGNAWGELGGFGLKFQAGGRGGRGGKRGDLPQRRGGAGVLGLGGDAGSCAGRTWRRVLVLVLVLVLEPMGLGDGGCWVEYEYGGQRRQSGIFAPCSGCGIRLGCGPRVGLVPRPTRGYRLQRLRRWCWGLKLESENLEPSLPPPHVVGYTTAVAAEVTRRDFPSLLTSSATLGGLKLESENLGLCLLTSRR
jgi:hypothetical protein